jgi:hypothetical protein
MSLALYLRAICEAGSEASHHDVMRSRALAQDAPVFLDSASVVLPTNDEDVTAHAMLCQVST